MLPTADKLKASKHENYWTFTLIAFVLPLVGLILGIVYLTKDEKINKKLGEHLVAISVLFLFLYGVVLVALSSNQAAQEEQLLQETYNQILQ